VVIDAGHSPLTIGAWMLGICGGPAEKLDRTSPTIEDFLHAVAVGVANFIGRKVVQGAFIAVLHRGQDEIKTLRPLMLPGPVSGPAGNETAIAVRQGRDGK